MSCLFDGVIADQCVEADIEMCEAGLLQGRQPSSQSHTVGCHSNCLEKKIFKFQADGGLPNSGFPSKLTSDQCQHFKCQNLEG